MVDSLNYQCFNEFYDWVIKWKARRHTTDKPIAPDVFDIISILKILGFSITLIDVSNPKDLIFKSESKGLRIVATCGHSGLRCCMEIESPCRCPENITDPKLWHSYNIKYEAKEENIDKVLNISAGKKYVIKTVLNQLLHIINKNDYNENLNEAPTKNKLITLTKQSAITESNEPLSLEVIDNVYNFNSAKKIDKYGNKNLETANTSLMKFSISRSSQAESSPKRYRSLDSLTGNLINDEIPDPTQLQKMSSFKNLHASSDLKSNSCVDQLPNTLKHCPTCGPALTAGYKKLLTAQNLMAEVLRTMENTKNTAQLSIDDSKFKTSTESLINVSQSSKAGLLIKSPSISEPNIPVSIKKRPPAKPLCRPAIRNTSSIKGISAQAVTPVSSKSNPKISKKPLEGTTGYKISAGIKPNPKYDHIKSTVSRHLKK